MTTWLQLQWCHFSQQVEASYQALTKFLPTQAVGGTTGGWLVIPVRQWYRDSKAIFLYSSEEFVELRRQTKSNMYIWHTNQ